MNIDFNQMLWETGFKWNHEFSCPIPVFQYRKTNSKPIRSERIYLYLVGKLFNGMLYRSMVLTRLSTVDLGVPHRFIPPILDCLFFLFLFWLLHFIRLSYRQNDYFTNYLSICPRGNFNVYGTLQNIVIFFSLFFLVYTFNVLYVRMQTGQTVVHYIRFNGNSFFFFTL